MVEAAAEGVHRWVQAGKQAEKLVQAQRAESVE